MILVVDDNADIRDTLREILEDVGFTVATAANGAEALLRLEGADDCRAVVLDLMMPVMDGWEFRRRQLADRRLATVPVVVLSAVAEDEAVLCGMNPVAVFKKPLQVGRLLQLLATLESPTRVPFVAPSTAERGTAIRSILGRRGPGTASHRTAMGSAF